MEPWFVAVLAVAVAAWLGWKSLVIVPEARATVIDRAGRPHRVAEPGVRFIVPLLDRVRARVDLREQVIDLTGQLVVARDDWLLAVDARIRYRVVDANLATSGVSHPARAVEQLAVLTIRNVVGALDAEQAMGAHRALESAAWTALDVAAGQWGLRVDRVEVIGIGPSPAPTQDPSRPPSAPRE